MPEVRRRRFLAPPCMVVVLVWIALIPIHAAAQGVPNIPRTPGELISGPNAVEMGRLAVIAFHKDYLFTFPEAPGSPGGDHEIRVWNLADPAAPVVTDNLGFTQHGFLAHGFMKRGDTLNSGIVIDVDNSGNISNGNWDYVELGWSHSGMSYPWGVTTYWSYGDTNMPAEIFLRTPCCGSPPQASFDHLGATGVIGHSFVLGDLLFFASDQSHTGIAAYDINDPTKPVLLDVLSDGDVGGYWPDPVGVNGNLYFFFPTDTPSGAYQIVDATDPTNLELVASRPVDGNPQYAQFQDEYAFTERYKIDLRTFEIVLELDEDTHNIDTSQFSMPLGNLVVTGGLWPTPGMAIWAHQAEPDTRGPVVGYHRPADGQTDYPVTHSIQVLVHETLKSETINDGTVILRTLVNGNPGTQVPSDYYFASNDILSIVPQSELAPDTTYQVEFVAGGVQDAVGNGMEPYSFTFSTGNTLGGGNGRPEDVSLSKSVHPAAPGQSVTFTAQATDPDGDPLEYRFDFGDGTPVSAWQSSNQSTHAYAAQGHFNASVQVRDSHAAVASAGLGVTVITPPTVGAGMSSGALARGGNGVIWTVNPDNDSVALLNDAGNLIAEYRTCKDPRSVAMDASNRAWITCHDVDSLLVMNADGEHLARLDTGYGSGPFAILFNAAGERGYVSLMNSGEVLVVDPATLSAGQRLTVGPWPRAMALHPAGNRLLVTRFLSPRMHGEIYDIATSGGSISLNGVIQLDHQWGPDTRFDGRGVPNYLTGIGIRPGGGEAWVLGKKDNFTRGLYHSGTDLDQDNTVRAMLARIDLASSAEIPDSRLDIDNSDSPSAVQFSPWGDYAFVALQGNNDVLILDALKIDAGFTSVSSVVSRVGVGLAPQSLLFNPANETLLGRNLMSRSVSRLDLSGLFGVGNATVPVTETVTVANESLPPGVLLGKQVFYNASDERMSGEGYISCATCHLDGGHDGRVLDFSGRGEGLRNTTSLRGRAGTGHGLVHWSANFDEIQDFELDIRNAFGGAGFMDDADFAATQAPLGPSKAGFSTELDALSDYVSSLDFGFVPRSPHRQPDGNMTTQGLAGAQVFADSSCADCHAGEQMVLSTSTMDLQLRDVGTLATSSGNRLGATLDGIDVPTLQGLWATGPYLHDGSAATISDVFVTTGGEIIQFEGGTLGGAGGEIRNADHWSIAGQSVVRAGAFAHLETGGSISTTIPGGSGGPAILRLRYAALYQDADVTVTLNGGDISESFPMTLFFWRYDQWESHDVPVTLLPGDNTLTISYNDGGGFALDEVLVTETNDLIAAGDPHLLAADLGATDFNNLLAFLEQLDGRGPSASAIAITSHGDGAGVAGPTLVEGTSGPAPGTVTLSLNTNPAVLASGDDNWSATIDFTGISDGLHTLTARHEDANGVITEQQIQVNVGGPVDVIYADGLESP